METQQQHLKTVEKAPRQSDASIEAVAGVTPSPALTQQQQPRSNEAADHFMSQVCSSNSPASKSVSSNDHSPPTTTSTASSTMMNDDDDDKDVRRSGRQRTSTVVQIDGHTVLKENNYVLKGLSYMFGDNTVVQAPAKKRKLNKANNNNKPKVPRVAPPEEVARQAHNSMIRKRVANKAKARLEHLARHQKTLQPFLDTASQAKLVASVGSAATEKHSELFLQPEAIQADMRDYQLAGLNWMVKMHDKNLGMIL